MQTSENIPEEVDDGVQDEENGNRGRSKRGRVRTRLEILKEGQTLPDTARRRTASPITTAWTEWMTALEALYPSKPTQVQPQADQASTLWAKH